MHSHDRPSQNSSLPRPTIRHDALLTFMEQDSNEIELSGAEEEDEDGNAIESNKHKKEESFEWVYYDVEECKSCDSSEDGIF